jgi:hypothetical protein
MAKTPVLAFKFGEVGKGLLSHFPIESPRLESPRTRIINPYAGSPFNISMRYIHSAILNPNFLAQEEVVTLNSFPIPSAAQTRAGPLQQSFSLIPSRPRRTASCPRKDHPSGICGDRR